MTKEQLLAALDAAEAELTARPRDLTGIAVERLPDANDASASISEMDVALHAVNSRGARLEQIRAARQRAMRGEGGICTECDEPIADKRLKAVPWAALCIFCQAAEDERQQAEGLRLDAVVVA